MSYKLSVFPPQFNDIAYACCIGYAILPFTVLFADFVMMSYDRGFLIVKNGVTAVRKISAGFQWEFANYRICFIFKLAVKC